MKKTSKVLLCLFMMLMCITWNHTVEAKTITGIQEELLSIESGDLLKGMIRSNSGYCNDMYEFEVTKPSVIKFNTKTSAEEVSIRILKSSNLEDLEYFLVENVNDLSEMVQNNTIYLNPGEYQAWVGGSGVGTYQIKFTIDNSNNNERESNDVIEDASKFIVGDTIKAQISSIGDEYRGERDYYKFTIPFDSTFKVNIDYDFSVLYFAILDENKNTIYNVCPDKYGDLDYYSFDIDLLKGNYYMSVTSGEALTRYYDVCGKYQIKTRIQFTYKKPSITLSNSSSTSAKVSWTKVSGADGYVIYRASSKNATYKKVATKSNKISYYVDKGLKTGEDYYYKVQAYKEYNSGKRKSYSPSSTIKRIVVKPRKVKEVKVSSATNNTIKLTWTSLKTSTDFVSGYQVYKANSQSASYKKVKTLTTNVYTNKNLKSKTSYYYKVRAYKNVNGKPVYGSFSTIVKATTK